MITKVCACCLKELPIDNFERCRFTDDLRFRYCPACSVLYYKTYKEINWNNKKVLEIIYEDITYDQFKQENNEN